MRETKVSGILDEMCRCHYLKVNPLLSRCFIKKNLSSRNVNSTFKLKLKVHLRIK